MALSPPVPAPARRAFRLALSGLLAGPVLFGGAADHGHGSVAGQEPDRPPAEPAPEARQETPEAASRVIGRLTDEVDGTPIEGALVTIEPAGRQAVTDSAGAFALGDVPPGRYELRIRHIAYGTRSLPVEVRAGMTTSLSLRLAPEAIALDPLEVRVEARFRPRYLEERGYYERRERGWGTFFDPVDVERWSTGFARGAEDFLNHLAFQAPSFSPLCARTPTYIDGRRVRREEGPMADNLLREMSASEIGAVELYTSSVGVPLFAFTDSTTVCGALVIWTRRWREPARLEALSVELCDPGADPGTVTVEGMVTDAYTEVRLPGARVEATLRAQDGSRRERRLSTTADEHGRYRLCDLPAGGSIGLRAAAAGVQGPAVLLPADAVRRAAAPLPVGARQPDEPGPDEPAADEATETDRTGDSARLLSVSRDLTVRISGPGRIVGRVTDRDAGRPVAAAAVTVAGTDAWTETDRNGYFLLEGVAPGELVIEVRHVGYGTVADSVSLPADRTLEVRVALSADPVELEPLVVTALRDRRLEVRGFYDRRQWGERTGNGRFFTVEEIERRNPLRISHLVRDVPGIRLACEGSRGCAIRAVRAPTCSHIAVYVDGVRMISGDAGARAGARGTVDELVHAAEVAAVEVYPGPASVPAEFSGPTGQCGAVAIWTR